MLSPSWLAPVGSSRSGSPSLDLWPVGRSWDVLRTPERLALPVLDRLQNEPDDNARLGPVLWDCRSEVVYWLLARGASASYPPGARLLPSGSWLAVPASTGRQGTYAHWLHLPEQPLLTGPAWLAHALRDHTDPQPGASAMTEPVEPVQPAERCQMCTEPPSSGGPVMQVGPDDMDGAVVDLGHDGCYRRAYDEMHARRRAAHPLPERVRA